MFFLVEQSFNMYSDTQSTTSKTLSKFYSVEFVLKRNSPNIPKLECQRSIDIARIKVSFRKIFVSTPGHFKEFLSSFHEWYHDLLFSVHFLKLKHNAYICSINLASCKNLSNYWIPMAIISGKQISTAKTLALNYFSPKVFKLTFMQKFKFA